MKKVAMFLLTLCFCLDLKSEPMAWEDPIILSSQGQDATDQQIALDSHGNSIAVWLENGFVMFSRKLTGKSWSLPAKAISNSPATEPQIGIDSHGNMTAAWIENGVVFAASCSLEGSWGNKTPLSSNGASSLKLVVDTAGDCIAIWNEQGSIVSYIRKLNGSWPQTPDVLSSSACSAPQVAIGGNGTVVAVWHDENFCVYSAIKAIDGSWNLPAQVIGEAGLFPQVAVDASGNALAVWYGFGAKTTLQFASCPFQGSWTAPAALAKNNVSHPAASDVKIAFDAAGNAIVLSKTLYVEDSYGTRVLVRKASGAWEIPVDLVAFNLYAHAADVALAAGGEAHVAYMYHDTESSSVLVHTTKAHIGTYDGSYWNQPLALSPGGINGYPKIAAAQNKEAMNIAVLWLNYNGAHKQVYAASGAKTVIEPPRNVAILQNTNNFGLFPEQYNTVSWEASPSQACAYNVFRNGEFFTRVPGNVLQIVDHNAGLNQAVTYGIAAVDEENSQSEMITVGFP
jgi:hypothetical protein